MSESPVAVVAPARAHALAALRAAEPEVQVLDVRDPAAFAAGHLPGAGHVAFAELRSRRAELPAREVPVLVVHDEPPLAEQAALALAARGYRRVWWLERPLGDLGEAATSREPAARLWSPSRFLERMSARLRRGRALDLACGSGRAAVYLALHGHDVEAWDVDPTALALTREFAARSQVRVATREVDLEAGPLPPPERRFDTIVVVRYLHRELFPWIEAALAPGGALVYETFRRGQERFGHPTRARHLLEPGELTRAFPGLRVECHEESPEHGPPVMARLFALRGS